MRGWVCTVSMHVPLLGMQHDLVCEHDLVCNMTWGFVGSTWLLCHINVYPEYAGTVTHVIMIAAVVIFLAAAGIYLFR